MVRLVLVLSPAASILAGIGAATLVAGVLSQCRKVYPGDSGTTLKSVSFHLN